MRKVEVWFLGASAPTVYQDVKSIYEFGSFQCIHFGDTVHMYPIIKILRVHKYFNNNKRGK